MQIVDIKHKIVDFYDFSDNEQEEILVEILEIANNSEKEQFIVNLRNHFPQFHLSGIEVIYEALIKEPEKWGDFFVAEFQRAFEEANYSSQSKEILGVLEDIGLMENINFPFADRIINLLAKYISTQKYDVSYYAIYYLADWLSEGNGAKHIALIKSLSNWVTRHSDWRIRYLSFYALTQSENKPKYLKIRLIDRIKALFNNPIN